MNSRIGRRDFLKATGAAAVSLAGGCLGPQTAHHADRGGGDNRPNIIFVLADDLSASDLSCYGGAKYDTPFMDTMAAEGVKFETAWAAPVCGPGRAMLLTGKYNDRTGLWPNAGPIWELRKHLLVGQAMKQAGYATATYGKLHHGGDPQKDYGFDEHCICRWWKGYDGQWQGRGHKTRGMYAVQWYWHPGLIVNGTGLPTGPDDFGPEIEVDRMIEFISRKRRQPFFTLWTTNIRHAQYGVDRGWSLPDVPELDENGRPTGKRIKASNQSNMHYLDAKIAQIAQAVERADLKRPTIIIFAGDNGHKVKGHGGKGRPQSEGALRVPLLVWGPAAVKTLGGRRELVDFTDIMPTLIELGGGKAADGLDGRSFAPLLAGKSYESRQWIRSQGAVGKTADGKEIMGAWARTDRWLLDANDDLWDCRDSSDLSTYVKVGPDTPGAAEARAMLERIRRTDRPVD